MVYGLEKMKFIKQENIITTIFNKKIEDKSDIKKTLTNIKREGLFFLISIRNLFPSDFFHRKISYDKVKIKKIYDDAIDIIICGKNATNHISDIKFDDIEEIIIITKKNNILDVKPDVHRYEMLDIQENDERN